MRLASSKVPVFLLTDLDAHRCPKTLQDEWRRDVALPDHFLFRIAVREVEAWLLGHRSAIAEFTGVAVRRLPEAPEELPDPKRFLLDAVRKYGRRDIRQEMLPPPKWDAPIGLGYNQKMTVFARDFWDPAVASEKCPSLRRAIERLRNWAQSE